MTKNDMVMVPRTSLEDVLSIDVTRTAAALECFRAALDQPAQQHQGEPVALPARRPSEGLRVYGQGESAGWNACLDEIAKLGPLYTHADTAEVESLKADKQAFAQNAVDLRAEVERLRRHLHAARVALEARARTFDGIRAQLAEAQALLQKVLGHLKAGKPGEAQVALYNALSASTEPSALMNDFSKQKHEAWRRAFYGEESAEPSAPKYHRDPLHMDEEVRERLTLIAREAAISSAHRYNYMPTMPENALAWQPHAWVLEAMRMVELAAEIEVDEPAEFEKWKERVGVGERGSWCAWQARAALERKP